MLRQPPNISIEKTIGIGGVERLQTSCPSWCHMQFQTTENNKEYAALWKSYFKLNHPNSMWISILDSHQ